jgi:hypothetical protein
LEDGEAIVCQLIETSWKLCAVFNTCMQNTLISYLYDLTQTVTDLENLIRVWLLD